MTEDQLIAKSVRYAVDLLNATIDVAQAQGIQVSLSLTTWTGLRPQKTHVETQRIERPANWRENYSGEML